MKVTYEDKAAVVALPNIPENWVAENANELKDVINDNAVAHNIAVDGSVVLDKTQGYFKGGPTNFKNGIISVDLTGAVNGGCAGVYYKGTASFSITGADVILTKGNVIEGELCVIFIVYDEGNNGVLVSVMDGVAGDLPSSIILFEDTFDGTVIDPAKWLVTNPDPAALSFTQNDELIIQALNDAGGISGWENKIESVPDFDLSDVVVLKFDMFRTSAPTAPQTWVGGLGNGSANDGIYFIRTSASQLMSVRVWIGGVSQYENATGIAFNNKWKVVKQANGDVEFFYYNSGWVSVGSYASGINTGTFKTCFTQTNGGIGGSELSVHHIDDLYVTNEDFITLNPA